MSRSTISINTIFVFAVIALLTVPAAFGQTSAAEFYQKGIAARDAGDLKAAVDNFKKANELDPSVLPASLSAVMTKMKAKDAPGAIAIASNAIKADPKDAFMYFVRATASMAPPNSPATSPTLAGDINKIIELVPTSPLGYFFRAALRLDAGEFDGSVADSSKAIELGAGQDPVFLAIAYSNRGRARLAKKDFDGAIADLTKAIGFDATNSEYFFFRATARSNKDDVESTIADFTKAIELDPANFQYHVNRGFIRNAAKDHTGAISDLTKAIELDPKNQQVPVLYFNRGAAKFSKDDTKGAIADFTKAIELDPKYADAYDLRGLMLAVTGDSAGSIADHTKAIQLDPANPEYYRHRSSTYEVMNKTALAAADEKKAAELEKK